MRTLTPRARLLTEASVDGEMLFIFCTISHPQLAAPIRVCNDTQDQTWQDALYSGFPFQLKLVADDDQLPQGSISFQNVDRRIGQIILTLRDRPKIRFQVVSSGDPDDVWLDYQHMELSNVTMDGITISADLTIAAEMGTDMWPMTRATQEVFPGLYR